MNAEGSDSAGRAERYVGSERSERAGRSVAGAISSDCGTISLNGSEWTFKGFIGEDWNWRGSVKRDTRDTRFWKPATVPGCVQNDLLANGDIPNPYRDTNSLFAEWVTSRSWVYRRGFALPDNLRGRRIRLYCAGLDFHARIYLNGDLLGRHSSMFVPFEVDVTERLDYSQENLLSIVLDPAPVEEPQIGRTDRVRIHKGRMGYWWDFCPRLPHTGIWDSVELRYSGDDRIADVWVRTTISAPEGDEAPFAEVSVESVVECRGTSRISLEYHLFGPGGRIPGGRIPGGRIPGGSGDAESPAGVERSGPHALHRGRNTVARTLQIEYPSLWWPNGEGDQPLYTLEVRLVREDATPDKAGGLALSDLRRVRFGIRELAVSTNPGSDSDALPYTLEVNGRSLFARGWNWVPYDVMFGVERPDKLRHLLTLARDAGVNLLRVWGGGTIERKSFYDICDEYGILVWQEFMQSSSGITNCPSRAPEFIRMMVDEARGIIPRKRNHPSLVVWCGGNELQDDSHRPLTDTEPVLGALREAVEAMDPDRIWFPTSPSGPTFGNSIEEIEKNPQALHDVHGPWEHQGLRRHYALYNAGTSLLSSEFGVEGMTNRTTLNRTVSAECQLPVSKDNPVYHHLGAWWIHTPLIAEAFPGVLEKQNFERIYRGSRLLHAEGLRYSVESNLRRRPHCSGELPWQFNEPFPNAFCTSAVDYYGVPKPVYYRVKAAYSRIHAMASYASGVWAAGERFVADIWVSVFGSRSISADVHSRGRTGSPGAGHSTFSVDAHIRSADGATVERSVFAVQVPHDGAFRVGTCSCDVPDVGIFFLTVSCRDEEDIVLSETTYPYCAGEDYSSFFELPGTRVEAGYADSTSGGSIRQPAGAGSATGYAGGLLEVRNTGECVAFAVELVSGADMALKDSTPGAFVPVIFSDNYLFLFPGEKRTIVVKQPDDGTSNAGSGGSRLNGNFMVEGWNFTPVSVGENVPAEEGQDDRG